MTSRYRGLLRPDDLHRLEPLLRLSVNCIYIGRSVRKGARLSVTAFVIDYRSVFLRFVHRVLSEDCIYGLSTI